MAKKYDVFISYSSDDRAIADEICECFDRNGIIYFIDRREIEIGDEYIKRLYSAINDSQIMLYLASRNSYESPWTNKELTYAIKKKSNKDILPYIIDDAPMPEDKSFLFADINICKISETSIDEIVQNIKSLLPSQKKYDIYIGGSRRNANEVFKIYNDLIIRGYSCFCWEDLSYEIDYASQIKKAIANSKLFVFYFSKETPYSKFVYRDASIARELGKPVLLVSSFPSNLPGHILFWVDKVFHIYSEELREEFYDECYRLIGPGLLSQRKLKIIQEESDIKIDSVEQSTGIFQKIKGFVLKCFRKR